MGRRRILWSGHTLAGGGGGGEPESGYEHLPKRAVTYRAAERWTGSRVLGSLGSLVRRAGEVESMIPFDRDTVYEPGDR